MNRPIWKSALFLMVVVLALLAVTQQASAWWGCYRPVYYGCYSPCYSSCYSGGCGGWSLGWRPGPIRRLLFGRYRWYYSGYPCYSYSCGYPCYGYSCGYPCYGCYNVDCCGATVGTVTTTPATAQPTPAQKPVLEAPSETPTVEMPKEPAPQAPPTLPGLDTTPGPLDTMPPMLPETPSGPQGRYTPTPENSGVITVWVPFDAKVTINGRGTKSTGSRRQFVSYGLKPGFSYKYDVHAEIVRDGQIVDEDQTVILTGGKDTAVVFGLDTTSAGSLASAQ